jgi:hypothetical protein
MAKFSMKRGGKEVGHAATYAQPHTMTGESISVEIHGEYNPSELKVSVGNISAKTSNPELNKNGEITMRGYGAATKGIKSRGPMG